MLMTCKQCLKPKTNDKFEEYPTKTFRSFRKICYECRHPSKGIRSLEPIDFKVLSKIVGTKQFYQQKWKSLLQSAKRRNLFFDLTSRDVVDIYQSLGLPCPYCNETMLVASVDRMDNSVGYVRENCILCCLDCNSFKGSLSRTRIANIYKHLFGDMKPSKLKL